MNTTQRRVHIELNRQFLGWCGKNGLSLKENSEVFFINERLLVRPEYIINNNIYVDILKRGEYNPDNMVYYHVFSQSFGTLLIIKEEDIWGLTHITKKELEEKHGFSF